MHGLRGYKKNPHLRDLVLERRRKASEHADAIIRNALNGQNLYRIATTMISGRRRTNLPELEQIRMELKRAYRSVVARGKKYEAGGDSNAVEENRKIKSYINGTITALNRIIKQRRSLRTN